MQIISGTALSKEIKSQLATEIEGLKKKYGRTPKLSIILVGENPDSMKYVKSKAKSFADVGMEGELNLLPGSVSQTDLLDLVHRLNHDDTVDGILIQLPLPAHIDTSVILENIDYHKDADGLHPMNAGKLSNGNPEILPCTPKGILSLLNYANVQISGKHAVVVGRSNLVGKPTAQLLLRENATVTTCHTYTENLHSFVKQADILILAMGSPNTVTPDMLKPGVIIIDVAMNFVDSKLAGDIYFERNLAALEGTVSAITPVPGGVGPMTITSLIQNTFDIYKRRMEK